MIKKGQALYMKKHKTILLPLGRQFSIILAYVFVAIVGFLGIFGKLRGIRVQTAAKKVGLYPNVILSVV